MTKQNIALEEVTLSYKHFTLNERKYLQELLAEGKSFRRIAEILERSPSSVSREVKRNRSKYKPHRMPDNPYWYNHWHAQNLYIIRRRKNQKWAIKKGSPAWNYTIDKLRKAWSPEQISGRWSKDHPDEKPIHYSTIYRYVKDKMFPKIREETHLRRRGKKKVPRNAIFNTIHPDRIIPQWPEEILHRERIGDWEGDTVYGGIGKGLLVTLVDRRSRFLLSALLPKRDASLTKDTIVELLKGLPVRSISLDNGSEFSEFRALEKELNTEVYFAEPHKPWQRGTNENTNDLLRFFFRKGFDFRTVTQSDVDMVVDLINSRPRKCLNWKTPAEVFFENGVALA